MNMCTEKERSLTLKLSYKNTIIYLATLVTRWCCGFGLSSRSLGEYRNIGLDRGPGSVKMAQREGDGVLPL